jgi:UDP-glucose 4-epimerase
MKFLIIGGTGSLGRALTERYHSEHDIFIMSRDESKQWSMKLEFPSVQFIIGDIRDRHRTAEIVKRVGADVIIIAAAMKHVDLCEKNTHECIMTNIIGVKNVLDSVPEKTHTVCFISTDKACNPGNAYGMCKGLSEIMVQEKAFTNLETKFVSVRFGNIIGSRGSIIPTLEFIGNDPSRTHFNLTHPDMNRYIMTKQGAVDLVDYAITNGNSGEIILPELVSMNIKDLFEVYSEKYNKPIIETGLRPGEKIYELLINEDQIRRSVKKGNYIHITPMVQLGPLPIIETRVLTKEEIINHITI